MGCPQLLGPQKLAGLVEALEAPCDARSKDAIANNERRGIRTVALARCVALEYHGIRPFPQRLPRVGAGGEHDLFSRPAIHRVKDAVLDRWRGIPFPERPLPDDSRPRRGPAVLHTAGFRLKIPVRTAPLRPGHGARSRLH